MGMQSVNQGLQVLGGYGYTEDFELEQLLRDVRIMSLYEGTTGIQAQAVLGRQIPRNGGKAIDLWLEEVRKDITDAEAYESLKPYAALLENSITEWKETSLKLLAIAAKGDAEVFLSDATLYLELFGILNVSWMWLKQGVVAQKALDEKAPVGEEHQFYASKLHTMKFYFHYELPKVKSLTERLLDNTILTVFNKDFEPIC